MPYLGFDGCCLICVERGDCDVPCFECKCTKCDWYDREAYKKCTWPSFKFEGEMVEDVEVLKETENAVLLRAPPFPDAWFPLSQIDLEIDIKSKKGDVRIPRWLSEAKKWICEDDWFELNGSTIKEYEERYLEGKSFSPSKCNEERRYERG